MILFRSRNQRKEGGVRSNLERHRKKRMKVRTTGRKITLSDNFVEKATKRLQKFDRFFVDEADATITASREKDRVTVEITVKSRGLLYRTERTNPDLETAFNDAADLMMRQIVKNKEKLGTRVKAKEVDLAVEELQLEPELEQTDHRIVREKRFMVESMSEEEAVLQMELLGHSFFLFRNRETEEINVVYRRHDDTFGLLIPIS